MLLAVLPARICIASFNLTCRDAATLVFPLSTMFPLLSAQNIRKSFGATQALRGVSFEVRSGEILALVGENGAGKSTLMKVLSGAHKPDAGEIHFQGIPYSPATPQAAREAGGAMIYQDLNLAPHLSVVDNIMLGREKSRFGFHHARQHQQIARMALDRLGHADMCLNAPVGKLSTAKRQLVEIARALAHNAKLLILDEPTSSLPREEVDRLFKVLERLKKEGVGIIYISHFLDELLRIADRYTVLRDGQSVGSGSMRGVSEAQLVSLMVGRSVEELFPQIPHIPGETLLELDQLTGVPRPAPTSLVLRRGEILGLAGLVGSGRTELIRAIAGLDPVRSGAVRVSGLQTAASPLARIHAGIGMVSEDRKQEGLAQNLSIEDNATLSSLSRHSFWGFLKARQRRTESLDLVNEMQIKARSPGQEVRRAQYSPAGQGGIRRGDGLFPERPAAAPRMREDH